MYIVRPSPGLKSADEAERYLNDHYQMGLEYIGMCGKFFIFRKIKLYNQLHRGQCGEE